MEQDTGSGVAPADLTELPAGQLTATGEPRVDAALRQLGDLDERPVSEHPPVFERVHGQLVDVLGELHSGTGQGGQGGQGAR